MELATTRAHQRGRYAGKKSGQEQLAGRPADRNKFIIRGAWLRSKEMEEIIMKLSMKEKKIFRLSQPRQYGDTAEMADGPDR